MTNDQIISKIKANKHMLGEYVIRMDNTAGDDDLTNMRMSALFEKCMDEIERLERTLEVRAQAKSMRAA